MRDILARNGRCGARMLSARNCGCQYCVCGCMHPCTRTQALTYCTRNGDVSRRPHRGNIAGQSHIDIAVKLVSELCYQAVTELDDPCRLEL